MKIVLDYNPSDGCIKDPRDGMTISFWLGLGSCELAGSESSNVSPVGDIIKLKEVGFTHDEIVEMHTTRMI